MRLNIILSLMALIVTCNAGSFMHAQENYVILVHKDNPVTSLSKKEVSAIFLKKKKKWENGTKIIPIDQHVSSKTRGFFSEDIHGRSTKAIRSYWQQSVFSGQGTPPVEKKNEIEIVEFVKNNPGAIAYVSADVDVSGVKTLSLTPLDP